MTLEYKEVEVKPLRQMHAHKISCDVCGGDAEVNKTRMASSSRQVNWTRFEFVQNNTEDNHLSDVHMFNEAVLAGVADLCEDCATKVKDFIEELSDKPLRSPDKYGS